MDKSILSEELKFFPEAHPLVGKWQKYVTAVQEAFGQELTLDRKVVLACALENTQNRIQQHEAMWETTQPSDIGPFKKFALELVTAVVPSLIAPDIVSVQPMTNRIGEVRYIQYLYGSDKGQTQAGQPFTSPFRKENSDKWYSSELVEEEDIGSSGDSTYTGTLSWLPIRPGTVSFTGSVTAEDDGNGNLVGTGVDGGTINYETGADRKSVV